MLYNCVDTCVYVPMKGIVCLLVYVFCRLILIAVLLFIQPLLKSLSLSGRPRNCKLIKIMM